jgi:acyl carrier protein
MAAAAITKRRGHMHPNANESRPADTLVSEIVHLLCKILYAEDGSVTPQTRLADLGLDSLDLVEAGLELEALLGRDLPECSLNEAETVGDLARCLGEPAPRRGLSLAA